MINAPISVPKLRRVDVKNTPKKSILLQLRLLSMITYAKTYNFSQPLIIAIFYF